MAAIDNAYADQSTSSASVFASERELAPAPFVRGRRGTELMRVATALMGRAVRDQVDGVRDSVAKVVGRVGNGGRRGKWP